MRQARAYASGGWAGSARDVLAAGAAGGDPWKTLAGEIVRSAFDRAMCGDGYARRWLVEVGESYVEWIANGDDDWIALYRAAVSGAAWYPIGDDEGVITARDRRRLGYGVDGGSA